MKRVQTSATRATTNPTAAAASGKRGLVCAACSACVGRGARPLCWIGEGGKREERG